MRFTSTLCLASAILLLPLMVSNQSLWIDEGSTGLFARQPDFGSFWRYLSVNTSSETQMPLALFLTWLWARVAGTSEFALRAINLVFGVLTLWALALVGRRLRVPWLPLFCAVQSYFWYFTGEARSYAFQITLGAWLLLAFVEFIQSDGRDIRWALLFTGAALILSCTTMLAPITLISIAVVGYTLASNRDGKFSRRAVVVIVGGAILSIPLGIYYADTLARGAKGAELWTVDVRYLAYILYDLSGLAGLGPPTDELRNIAHASYGISGFIQNLPQFALPLLCAGALGLVVLLGRSAFRERSAPQAGALLAVFLGGTLLFFIASIAAQKAFWGRHYAALFPFYITGLSLVISAAWNSSSARIARPVTALLFILLLTSGLSIRFAQRHQRDDYRGAAAFASDALQLGKTVWWIAAPEGAEYYHVPVTYDKLEPGSVFCPLAHTGIPSTRSSRLDINSITLPDLIIVSKPETYDTRGKVRYIITKYNFTPGATFKTFVVWKAPAPGSTVPQ